MQWTCLWVTVPRMGSGAGTRIQGIALSLTGAWLEGLHVSELGTGRVSCPDLAVSSETDSEERGPLEVLGLVFPGQVHSVSYFLSCSLSSRFEAASCRVARRTTSLAAALAECACHAGDRVLLGQDQKFLFY